MDKNLYKLVGELVRKNIFDAEYCSYVCFFYKNRFPEYGFKFLKKPQCKLFNKELQNRKRCEECKNMFGD